MVGGAEHEKGSRGYFDCWWSSAVGVLSNSLADVVGSDCSPYFFLPSARMEGTGNAATGKF